MFTTKKSLLAATASLALMAGPVLSASHTQATGTDAQTGMTTDTTAGATTEMSTDTGMTSETDAEVEADTDVKVESDMSDLSRETGAALDAAGDAIADTAKDAATATGKVLDDAARATENAAESTAATIDNAATATANAAEDFGAMIEAEFGAIAHAPIGDLVGTDVVTATGEDVGEVDGFAIENGTLVALVGIGGFLGLGEHDVALDVSRLGWDAENEAFVVKGYTQEELEALPQYDEDRLTILDDDSVTLVAAANGEMGATGMAPAN